MAKRSRKIARDKKRNTHFFQRMDEWKRILRIGAGAGPKYCDLKRERFWKLLEWVSVLMNDFDPWDFFDSQSRRGSSGKFPNCGAPAQSEH
jgi:hypothetical protein